MIKKIISLLLAIGIGFLFLKIIGLFFAIMFAILKYGLILIIAIPFYFLVKKVISKL